MKQSVLHLPEGAEVNFNGVRARLAEPAHFIFDGDRDSVAVDLAAAGQINQFLPALEHEAVGENGEKVTVKYSPHAARHEFPIEASEQAPAGDQGDQNQTGGDGTGTGSEATRTRGRGRSNQSTT